MRLPLSGLRGDAAGRDERNPLQLSAWAEGEERSLSTLPVDGSPRTFGTQTVSINSVICFVMLLSVAICAVVALLSELSKGPGVLSAMTGSVYEWGWMTVANIALIEFSTTAMVMMSLYNRRGEIRIARYITRVLVVLLLLTAASCLLINGMTPILLAYVVQLACVVAYQIANDPNLTENVPQASLDWRLRVRSAFASMRFWDRKRGSSSEDVGDEETTYRTSYMPLNFFNLFWIFVIGSVVGLILETVYHVVLWGAYEDRAGLLWGPFSPIYGVGAVCLTVGLNRYWRAPAWKVFLVGGLIGSLVEYATSWYLEKALGVIAWDYSQTFGNVNGRVNVFFFFVWGLLGLLWLRTLLPLTMRLVDAIRLDWRAWLTIAMFCFLLVDQCMTVLTTDCWSRRHSGHEPTTAVEIWCAESFGDEYMERRFQSMKFGDKAIHTQIEDEAQRASNEGWIGPVRLF